MRSTVTARLPAMAMHIIIAIVLLFITVAMTTGADWGTGAEKTKSVVTAAVLSIIMGALIGWGSTLLS